MFFDLSYRSQVSELLQAKRCRKGIHLQPIARGVAQILGFWRLVLMSLDHPYALVSWMEISFMKDNLLISGPTHRQHVALARKASKAWLSDGLWKAPIGGHRPPPRVGGCATWGIVGLVRARTYTSDGFFSCAEETACCRNSPPPLFSTVRTISVR